MRISDWSSDVCSSDLAHLVVGLDHLPQAALLRQDQVVGEQHRHRLRTDEVAAAPHRVPETQRLLLAGEGELARCRDGLLDQPQRLLLATCRKHVLQLVGVIEMVLDRGLRSEEHTYELQSLMRNSYDFF